MREIPIRYKLVFGILNIASAIVSSVFLLYIVNGVKDLFADLGANLPTLANIIVSTSPLFSIIVFLMYFALGLYFFISSKAKPTEAKVFDTLALLAWMIMIVLSFGTFIVLYLPIYQISDYIK